jgi:hypothetical protein
VTGHDNAVLWSAILVGSTAVIALTLYAFLAGWI